MCEEITPVSPLHVGLGLYYPPRSAQECLASKKLPGWSVHACPGFFCPEARGRGRGCPPAPLGCCWRTGWVPPNLPRSPSLAASARGSTHPGMGTPHLPALPMGEMAPTKERENNKRLDPASQIIHGDISSSPFVYLIEKLIGSFWSYSENHKGNFVRVGANRSLWVPLLALDIH